jgi:hypothetical protein
MGLRRESLAEGSSCPGGRVNFSSLGVVDGGEDEDEDEDEDEAEEGVVGGLGFASSAR